MAKIEGAFNLPFREQLAFWERKEVKGTLHWQDISRAEHDKNFVVAGAMKADLLHDLQASLKGLQGGSLETFRKNFREIVAKHGWHGWTGEGTAKGEAWRTKVIWQTNIRASYAAGRYAQLTSPEAREALPYWKYMHSNLVKTPRQDHLEWHGLTLPNDHPFWKKAFPPNGFGCRCYVIGVMEPDENARTVPPEGWESKIGKGWDYAPGESVADEVRQIVAAKAAGLPAELGASLFESVAPLMSEPLKEAASRFVENTARAMQAKGETALMHIISPTVVAAMKRLNHPLETSGVWLTDDALLHGIRDTKAARGAALPLSTWKNLPALMDGAEVWLDTLDNRLLFVFQSDGSGKMEKVAVAVNYVEKARLAGTKGKRQKLRSNYIRTGGLVDILNIDNNPRYVFLR